MDLRIYISEHCWGCEQARETAAQMRRIYSELTVELVDVDRPDAETPAEVFATPTYVLNGRIVSLGNPKPETLRELIATELGSLFQESPLSI
jgi:hypothetical protein